MGRDNSVVGYDIKALKRGLESINTNIAALEAGLEAERGKKQEYERHIAQAQAILDFHGVDEDGNPQRRNG